MLIKAEITMHLNSDLTLQKKRGTNLLAARLTGCKIQSHTLKLWLENATIWFFGLPPLKMGNYKTIKENSKRSIQFKVLV